MSTPQRIVISGASGLIGSALTESLRNDGVQVIRLVRRAPRSPEEVQWLPGSQSLDPMVLAGAQAVVNLNGASIGKLPWGRKYREVLRESRLLPTRTIAQAIRELGTDAPHFLSASAVGFYGSQPGELLSEASEVGDTFLAELSNEWEQEASAAGPDARVALIRTAPILHPQGVLKPLMQLTRFGLSGPLGTGTQTWPFISLEDEVRAIRHIIDNRIVGPVNLTAPRPATANEIGREIALQMRRPYLLTAPGWALRLGLGRDAADSLLLADARVLPNVLEHTGFVFQHPKAKDVITSQIPSRES